MYREEIITIVVKEYCSGDSAASIARRYGVGCAWVMSTVRKFNDGVFDALFFNAHIDDETIIELKKTVSERLSQVSRLINKHDDETIYKALKAYAEFDTYKNIEAITGMSHAALLSYIKKIMNDELSLIINGNRYSESKMNELKILVSARKNPRKSYDISFKLQVILEYIDSHSTEQTARKYKIDSGTVLAWSREFLSFPMLYNHLMTTSEQIKKIEQLQLIVPHNSSIQYELDFKYRAIEQLISQEKNVTQLSKELGVGKSSIRKWVRDFAQKGSLGAYPVEYSLEQLSALQNKAKEYVLMNRHWAPGDFSWLVELKPELSEWKELSEKWFKEQNRASSACYTALSRFFREYIIPNNIYNIKEFISKDDWPDFYELLYKKNSDQGSAYTNATKIVDFIDWILYEYYSIEDDYGNKRIPYEFQNPMKKFLPDYVYRRQKYESDKNVLPYAYIRDLRKMLCPENAANFSEWEIAQNLTGEKANSGDWFVVDKSQIDKNDKDCVYRIRKPTKYEQKKYGYDEEIIEMWYPGTAVALLLKLLIPLRTYQVRMLDSGEADTYMYVQPNRFEAGYWQINNISLAEGSERKPHKTGVFRKYRDPITNNEYTGFYINTNKTADIGKDEVDKGYEMPWQYEEALYWLTKLRDWQVKYNGINHKIKWIDLSKRHLGSLKSEKILKRMGSITFLFRNPCDKENNGFPITSSSMNTMWYKLLALFEKINENKFEFVVKDSYSTTYYPLHSLRVSLITAYAIDGGVPMPILQKCIAGHARLVMTLYYTKMGVTYVTDAMTKAEQQLVEKEGESFCRFVREADYKQLKNNTVTVDESAILAALNSQQSCASILLTDKGICPQGCSRCNVGGMNISDETGTVTYGPVPGFPEANCVRCRWFITGPAFLPGLVHHFNMLGYKIAEMSKIIQKYQCEIENLEDEKYKTELSNTIFSHNRELILNQQLLSEALLNSDKLANDYNATLRLIDKCQLLLQNNTSESESLKLVAIGNNEDLQLNLRVAENELEQLQVICNGAEIYHETDASKAILQRSQVLDMVFSRNGFSPVMFALNEDEQLKAGNQFMRLLINRAGSIKNALPYTDGRKRLAELGFTAETILNITESTSVKSKLLLKMSKDEEEDDDV